MHVVSPVAIRAALFVSKSAARRGGEAPELATGDVIAGGGLYIYTDIYIFTVCKNYPNNWMYI